MKVALPDIRHDRSGFDAIIQLANRLSHSQFDDIEIDGTHTTWFDADMCAPFGAVLYGASAAPNSIQVTGLPNGVDTVLCKNGFLSAYGREKVPDRWGTTIPYQRFDAKDERFFAAFVERELVQRHELPKMSEALIKKFRESVFEIFSNAVLHSRTKLGIFSCGQFFPKRHQLDFAVADLGVGMKRNVREKMGFDLRADEAISWATDAANTTKRGQIPGGLGLKLLRSFISKNGGKIQIVSDAGYWCQMGSAAPSVGLLSSAFPGTVVAIEINTADTNSYRLASELSPKDIF